MVEAKLPKHEGQEDLKTLEEWLTRTERPEAARELPLAAPSSNHRRVQKALAGLGYSGDFTVQARWTPAGNLSVLDILFIGETWSVALRGLNTSVPDAAGDLADHTAFGRWSVVQWQPSVVDQRVAFHGCTEDQAGGPSLAYVKKEYGQPSDIQSLLVATRAEVQAPHSITATAALFTLEVLELDAVEVGVNELEIIGSIPHLGTLRLYETTSPTSGKTEDQEKELAALFSIRGLTKLHLRGNQFDLRRAAAEGHVMEGLQGLFLSQMGEKMANGTMPHIASIFPDITALYLHSSGVSNDGIRTLTDQWPRNVRFLSLDDNSGIDSDGLRFLLGPEFIKSTLATGASTFGLVLSSSQANKQITGQLEGTYKVHWR